MKVLKVLGVLMIPVVLVLANIFVWYPVIGLPEDGGNWIASIIAGPMLTALCLFVPLGIFIGMRNLIRWALKETP